MTDPTPPDYFSAILADDRRCTETPPPNYEEALRLPGTSPAATFHTTRRPSRIQPSPGRQRAPRLRSPALTTLEEPSPPARAPSLQQIRAAERRHPSQFRSLDGAPRPSLNDTAPRRLPQSPLAKRSPTRLPSRPPVVDPHILPRSARALEFYQNPLDHPRNPHPSPTPAGSPGLIPRTAFQAEFYQNPLDPPRQPPPSPNAAQVVVAQAPQRTPFQADFYRSVLVGDNEVNALLNNCSLHHPRETVLTQTGSVPLLSAPGHIRPPALRHRSAVCLNAATNRRLRQLVRATGSAEMLLGVMIICIGPAFGIRSKSPAWPQAIHIMVMFTTGCLAILQSWISQREVMSASAEPKQRRSKEEIQSYRFWGRRTCCAKSLMILVAIVLTFCFQERILGGLHGSLEGSVYLALITALLAFTGVPYVVFRITLRRATN